MVGSGSHQAESMESKHENPFVNLEHKRNREGSVHIVRTGRSQSRGKSHLFHKEDNRALQLEVDQLKRNLRRAQQKQIPSNSDVSSEGAEDTSYRQRSRTPPSESFSYEVEHQHKRRYKSPTRRGLGNDVIRKALN